MDNPQSPFAEPAGEQPEVLERLEAVERRLREVAHRLDQLEGSLTEVMAAENHELRQEVRHTMSELGRLIVKDLGRLGKLIEQDHRRLLDAVTPPEPAGQGAHREPSPAEDDFEEPDPDPGQAHQQVVIITDDARVDAEPGGDDEADDRPDGDEGVPPDEDGPEAGRRRRGPFRARRG